MSDKVIGRALSMGWHRRKKGDVFRVVIELYDPPSWPFDVVWKARPIELSLVETGGVPSPTAKGEA